jgi:hypothetical protein
MEKIIGSFEARQANTWTSDVQYQVFVSAERAVAVRTGGQFGGETSQFVAHQFGLLGMLFHKWFLAAGEARRKAEKLKTLEQSTMSELLARHPKNFELPFISIKRARLERKRISMHGASAARLVFEPQSAKPVSLLLQSDGQLGACRELLEPVLAGRLALDPKLPPRVMR